MPILNVTMRQQGKTNWCWAAVTEAIRNYYAPYSPDPKTQQEIVRTIYPGLENQKYVIEYVMNENYSNQAKGFLPFKDIMTEIDNGRPICCMSGINVLDYHYTLLIGYYRAPDRVIILDSNSDNNLVQAQAIVSSIFSKNLFMAYFTQPA
ncbi:MULTISPECIES: C39 family peptidase [Serratia]|uniref:C39 family peptidase n=1 Tax=Serratia TaxID=613 RepID=UPI0018D36661|nr:C39 family peptidase [Serratia marcescens]MBH2676342.1 C39 family peptidase [Serratia marcescens]